jgi:CRP-like cAMP-binding protein
MLHQAGSVARQVYFIGRGAARSFYYDDGRDVTYWIALENDIVGSVASYISTAPSTKSVETLEDCVLWVMDRMSLDQAAVEDPAIGAFMVHLLGHAVVGLEKRLDELQFRTAKERYTNLLAERPEVLRRVPLGMVASYLGMTQETLSRVRRK